MTVANKYSEQKLVWRLYKKGALEVPVCGLSSKRAMV